MNMLDRAIEAVAPIWGARRAAARALLAATGSGYGNYGANMSKKSMRGWGFYGGSAKEDSDDHVGVLRERSRDAYMGIPVATSALKTLRTNVIAGGLIPAPQVDASALGMGMAEAEAVQEQILREFSLWADTPACDADRTDNFYQLQQLAFLSYLMNGDVFALLQWRDDPGTPYSLRIRLVEADRICSPDGFDRLAPCDVHGRHVHRIVQGIETDADGMVLAYWISDRHPLSSEAGMGRAAMQWQRVEPYGRETGERQVLHVMARERVGQLRGVPALAPVLEAVKQLGRYTDAEVMAAVISSMFTVFVEKEGVSDARPFGEMLPPDMLVDEADRGTMELGAGAFVDLLPGERVKFADPKHPATGYDGFTSAVIRQVGAALEIPCEVLFKQFTTTYSAARGALNEFWRTCAMYQDWFKDDFCRPVWEAWMAEAAARGRIPAQGFFDGPAARKAWCGCAWSGPARTSLNPVQEVQAAMLRVSECFSTAQEETAQMTGGNWARNVRQGLIEAARKREVDVARGTLEGGMDEGKAVRRDDQ